MHQRYMYTVRRGFMKKITLLLLMLCAASLLNAGGQKDQSVSNDASVEDSSAAETLTIYCYDSFASEWGPGPAPG